MNWSKLHPKRLLHPPVILIIGCVGVLCLAAGLILSSPLNPWDSEKNLETLYQKASFENDCPVDKIEVVHRYDKIKSLKLNVCGKVYKYKYHRSGDNVTWEAL